jgi:predicted metal-dependent phosphoesterase TrpH
MGYKEKVQDEIKEEKLKNLWQEICKSYEEGGIEQIKSTLNSRIDEIKKNYEQLLENLKKML